MQARISGLENAIANRREFYNESVHVNNMRVEQFPIRSSRVCSILGNSNCCAFRTPKNPDVNIAQLFELRQKDGVYLMCKPADRRPFLIANRKVEAMIRHYDDSPLQNVECDPSGATVRCVGGIVFLASTPGIF